MLKLKRKQQAALDFIYDKKLANVCMPTGSGKSLVIYNDILRSFSQEPKVFCLTSARLMLNIQHFNEMFRFFEKDLAKIRFVCVGSQGPDHSSLPTSVLTKIKVPGKDLVKSTLHSSECRKICEENFLLGLNTIFISTYHSLDKLEGIEFETFYGDEAHNLVAKTEFGLFKHNYEKITAKKKCFFTATTKDSRKDYNDDTDDEDIIGFMMDNKDVFGERFLLSYREAIEEEMIVIPKLHLIDTESTRKTGLRTPDNYVKIITECYDRQAKDLALHASNEEHIEHKLLVKCESVQSMWDIFDCLKTVLPVDFDIFAGASDGKGRGYSYTSRKKTYGDQSIWLEELKKLPNDKKCIVLHFDVLSEGIDVAGFTGVVFLSRNFPSLIKFLQNLGRAQRLLPSDRGRSISHWVKKFCYAAIPLLDEMNVDFRKSADLIRRLRDDYGLCPQVIVSDGDDTATNTGNLNNLLPVLTMLDNSYSKTKIGKLLHEIEDLDKEFRQRCRIELAKRRNVDPDKWLREKVEAIKKSEEFDEFEKEASVFYGDNVDPKKRKYFECSGMSEYYTPAIIREKMWLKAGMEKVESILVMFNWEFVRDLWKKGHDMSKVTFISDDVTRRSMTRLLYGCRTYDGDGYNTYPKELYSMKFDLILSNPPFNGGVDLKILKNVIDLGEKLVLVHPSTWLLDAENNPKSKYYSAKEVANTRLLSVIMVKNGNETFNISNFSPIAITTFGANDGKIKVVDDSRYFHSDSHTYEVDTIFDIDKYRWYKNYGSIKKKILEYHNKFPQRIENDKEFIIGIPQIRGHVGNSILEDFYTFIQKQDETKHFNLGSYKIAVSFDSKEEQLNCFNYLKTKFARFCLSIYKRDGNMIVHGVPKFDFTKPWTDEECAKELGITNEELLWMIQQIPDYYENDTVVYRALEKKLEINHEKII